MGFYAADQLATVHPKRRGHSDYWLAVDLRSHQPLPWCRLWSRRETTTRRPGTQGPPLPHQPVSWSTTQRPVETPPGPTPIWIDQVRKDNGVGIPPARGERQVVVTEEQRYDPCWLRDDDDDDGLLTDMRAFVLHSARAHGVHWPDCANSAKCSDLITDKIHWTSLDKFHKVISFGHHGCGRHGHGLRPIWLWPIRLNPQTSR